MSPAEPVVVVDGADTIETYRALVAHHRPRGGGVVVEVAPYARSYQQSNGGAFAGLVLDALGKPPAADRGRNGGANIAFALAWLAALGSRDLIVLRASLLRPPSWRAAQQLAERAGMRLWMVCQERPRAQRSAGAWAARAPRTAAEAIDELGAPADERPAAAADPAPPFPAVSRESFVVWRAACREAMRPADFLRADAVFMDSVRRVRALAKLDLPALQEAVRDAVRRADSLDETICRLRGLQVGCYLGGTLLSLSEPVIADRVRTRERVGRSEQFSERLLGCPSPHEAAVGLLCGLSGEAPARLRSIALSDVAADGSRVDVHGVGLDVPAPMTSIARALVALRGLEGAEPDDPLFSQKEKRSGLAHGAELSRQPASTQTLGVALRRVAQQTGLTALADHAHAHAHPRLDLVNAVKVRAL